VKTHNISLFGNKIPKKSRRNKNYLKKRINVLN